MSQQRKYLLGSGHGRVVPGGGWNGLDTLDEHVKSVDIGAAQRGSGCTRGWWSCVQRWPVQLQQASETRDVRSEWEGT